MNVTEHCQGWTDRRILHSLNLHIVATEGETVTYKDTRILTPITIVPRPALLSNQHRTLVRLFWSGDLHCAHSLTTHYYFTRLNLVKEDDLEAEKKIY